jgi:hypothetical protein
VFFFLHSKLTKSFALLGYSFVGDPGVATGPQGSQRFKAPDTSFGFVLACFLTIGHKDFEQRFSSPEVHQAKPVRWSLAKVFCTINKLLSTPPVMGHMAVKG